MRKIPERARWPKLWDRSIKDIVARLGISIYVTKTIMTETGSATYGTWFCGNNQTTYCYHGLKAWEVLHEIGHWVAASPKERLIDNFGLDDYSVARAQILSTDKVEIDACKVHFALMEKIGISFEKIYANARYINFIGYASTCSYKSKKAEEAYVRRLIKVGHRLIEKECRLLYERL